MEFFTVEKIERLLREIRAAVYREVHPIRTFKFLEGECEGAEQPSFDDSDWSDFCVGDRWGGYDVVAWFRARVPIPPHLRGGKLALRFRVGPRNGGGSTAETMLYVDGAPLQGLDVWHEEAWLPPEVLRDDELCVALKAWSGVLDVPEQRRFELAQLVRIDDATERLYYRCNTLLQAVRVLDEHDLRRVQILQALNDALHCIDFTRPGSPCFYDTVRDAELTLRQAMCALEAADEIKPTVIGVGHAHIDMAWLWRLCHTREKAGRTFATVLHLMRRYPEYRFLHSSPQLFKHLQTDYPQLFARIREKVTCGAWEVTGGMWVEADTNLPSGESLVRQFLFGKRYLEREFGVEPNVVWLPDVFGYSWALPQIIAKSGMRYFLTTKISWSQFNRFPHDTFRWRGIDGTEVLTHFVTTPEDGVPHFTYNGRLTPKEVAGMWQHYQQKAANDELLHLFGWGDGGGGPTKEMLEAARTMRNLPGIPRVELGSAEDYFERLEQRVADRVLPVWDGELYLEYHRGTYTSQAWIKRANRRAEVLYHDAEWLTTVAGVLAGTAYPHEQLRAGWERILLNQFHDILPGSSIRDVYEDSREDYAAIDEIGECVIRRAQSALLARIPADRCSLVALNSLPWSRDGLLEVPWSDDLHGQAVAAPDGEPVPGQVVTTDGEQKLLLYVPSVPALGYQTYPLVTRPESAAEDAFVVTPTHLENRYYHITLDDRGRIASLFDKRHRREVLAPDARGNVFQAFEDRPMAYDAWDIDLYYQEKQQDVEDLVDVHVEECGPLRGVLRLRWRFYDSTITQRITLYAHSPRIDFRTVVDWHQHHVLLKVAFPVNVRARRATYEIQFGAIERPTHWNTSWDYARFEVVGHKWVDLSEGNYGVSLLNDCKYGHDVKDNVLRLTLIKSATAPDPTADQGRHEFTYSLLPHAGGWREGGAVRAAYDLNYPLRLGGVLERQGGDLPPRYAFGTLDSDHVVLETVKRAEDDDAWIVRLYECKQYRNNAVSIDFAHPVERAVECNLMEQEEQPVSHEGTRLTFAIAPYEIKTFKVWF